MVSIATSAAIVLFVVCVVCIGVYRAQRKYVLLAALLAALFVAFLALRVVVRVVVTGVVALVALAWFAKDGNGRRAGRAWLGARRDWKHIAKAHDLEGGRVVLARPTSVGRVLTVRLPRGATLDALAGGTIASATSSQAAVVRRGPMPRVVHVAIRDGDDPLRHPVDPAPLGWECPDLDHLTLGVLEDGTPWRQRLRGQHLFVAGETGSGKSAVIWGIVTQLAPGVATGHVRIVALDPKGGMELGLGEPLFAHLATVYADMLRSLRSVVAMMDDRAARFAGKTRLHTPTEDDPLIVVLIDELATLTAYHPDMRVRQAFANVISLLLSKGRAVGVVVVGAVQDPRKEIVPMRSLFSTRVALRLAEAIQVPMVLGEGARERGAEADVIDPALPGVAYVVEDGTRDPLRVRAAHVTDGHIKDALAHVEAMQRGEGLDTFGVRAPTLPPTPAHTPTHARARDTQSTDARTPKVRKPTRAQKKAANREAWAERERQRKAERRDAS